MSRPYLWAPATAIIALFVLSGCASGEGYSDLNREATADDERPNSLPEHAAQNIEPNSSRLVGHDGSTALYLVESEDPSGGVCLLIYPEDNHWVVGCGAHELTVGGGSPTYVVRGDGALNENDVAISENVSVRR